MVDLPLKFFQNVCLRGFGSLLKVLEVALDNIPRYMLWPQIFFALDIAKLLDYAVQRRVIDGSRIFQVVARNGGAS